MRASAPPAPMPIICWTHASSTFAISEFWGSPLYSQDTKSVAANNLGAQTKQVCVLWGVLVWL